MAKHGATSDDPVFVDAAGRRHRVLAVLGAAAGVLAVVAIVTIAIGLIGGASNALPDLPHRPHPATTAVQPGVPAGSPQPSATPGQRPSGSPTPTDRHHRRYADSVQFRHEPRSSGEQPLADSQAQSRTEELATR